MVACLASTGCHDYRVMMHCRVFKDLKEPRVSLELPVNKEDQVVVVKLVLMDSQEVMAQRE